LEGRRRTWRLFLGRERRTGFGLEMDGDIGRLLIGKGYA
jgi:hypothetical protein